jgi:hypothetical protein
LFGVSFFALCFFFCFGVLFVYSVYALGRLYAFNAISLFTYQIFFSYIELCETELGENQKRVVDSSLQRDKKKSSTTIYRLANLKDFQEEENTTDI